jgi:hypothetical protein
MNWFADSLTALLDCCATLVGDQMENPFDFRRQDTAIYLACAFFSPKAGNISDAFVESILIETGTPSRLRLLNHIRRSSLMGASADLRPVLRGDTLLPCTCTCWIMESSCFSHFLSWLGATPFSLARALRDRPSLLQRILLTIDARLIFSLRGMFFLLGMMCR